MLKFEKVRNISSYSLERSDKMNDFNIQPTLYSFHFIIFDLIFSILSHFTH